MNVYWPLITRRKHMREFTELSQTYQRELTSEKGKRFNAEKQLERERYEWADILKKLRGYQEGGVTYMLDGPEDIENIRHITVDRSNYLDATVFAFKVTNFLMDRAMNVLDRREINLLVRIMEMEIKRTLMERLLAQTHPKF